MYGLLYAVLVVLFSQLLIRNLHILIRWISAGLAAGTAVQIIQVAQQLKDAALVSPWLIALTAGGLIGLLMRAVFSKPKVRLWVSIITGTVFLLPLSLFCLYYTEVNSVCVAKLLPAVLPLLL